MMRSVVNVIVSFYIVVFCVLPHLQLREQPRNNQHYNGHLSVFVGAAIPPGVPNITTFTDTSLSFEWAPGDFSNFVVKYDTAIGFPNYQLYPFSKQQHNTPQHTKQLYSTALNTTDSTQQAHTPDCGNDLSLTNYMVHLQNTTHVACVL